MRPVGFDTLQNLVESGHLDADIIKVMPTFTVYEREDTYDLSTGRWRKGPLLDSDCIEYKCLLDSSSPDCVASQVRK